MKLVKFVIWLLILTTIISTIYILVNNWNEIATYLKIVICGYVTSCIIGLVGSIVTAMQDYQIKKLIKKLYDNTNAKEN